MDSFDRLVTSSIDNERALGDFKQDLAELLEVKVDDITITIGTSTNHSIISQNFIVTVNEVTTLYKEVLDSIPFDSVRFRDYDVVFIFSIGEASL